MMKLGICFSKGVTLIVLQAQDLSLPTIRHKIGDLLPLRDLSGHDHLYAYLESVCHRYRLEAKRRTTRP